MFPLKLFRASCQFIKWINLIGVVFTICLFIKLNIPAPPVIITDPQFTNTSLRPLRPVIHIPSALIYTSKMSKQHLLVHDERTDLCPSRRNKTDCDVSIIIYIDDLTVSHLHNMLSMLLLTTDPGITLDIVIIVDVTVDQRIFQMFLNNYAHIKGILFKRTHQTGPSQALVIGGEFAKGSVLIFMNGAIWPTRGWIMELCLTLKQYPQSITYPHSDYLKLTYDKWVYDKIHNKSIASFDPSDLTLHFIPVKKSTAKRLTNETRYSPTINPHIFATTRRHYNQLGAKYKTASNFYAATLNLGIWTWFKGGKVIMQPCSIVAHSGTSQITLDQASIDQIKSQWMISTIKDKFSNPKEVNHTYSKWSSFVENFYPIFHKTVETNHLRTVQNIHNSGILKTKANHCLNTVMKPKSEVQLCTSASLKYSLSLFSNATLRSSTGQCLTAVDQKSIRLNRCYQGSKQQLWKYDSESKLMINTMYDMCLTTRFDFSVSLERCHRNRVPIIYYSQRWQFSL